MGQSDIPNAHAGKTKSEVQAEFLKLYSSMPPERFFEHIENMQSLAIQSGRDNEREEIVCHLLANGMPVEEIAVVLNVRADAIRMIEHNNAAFKIPGCIKKLKERRRRREKAAEKAQRLNTGR